MNVLVTGVGGRSVGNGIRFALEQMHGRYNIFATDADPFSFGLYKTAHGFVVPPATSPDYCEALNEIIIQHQIEAVFPGTIPEIETLAKSTHRIKARIITNLNADLVEIARDKFSIFNHLKKLGIHTPETVTPDSVNDLIRKCGFPLIVKPTTGTGGSRNVTFVENETDLALIRKRYEADNIQYVFQEIIGGGEDEYTVGILNDRDGKLIDSIIIHRKLTGLSLGEEKTIGGRKYTISTGYSQGFIIKNETVASYCEHVANLLKSKGPLNLQVRVSNDRIYVFEVHPRFSGTTPIRASAGFNEPDVLFRNFIFGEHFGRLEYQYDVAAIRAFEHVLVPLHKLKTRGA